MNIGQPSISSALVALAPFLGQARTGPGGDADSFWGEMAWTLLPAVIILLLAVWCKYKMQEPD
jgi:hypothetical protein